MTIEKRARSGSIAGIVGLALNLLQSILLVPLLLSFWHAEDYGLWMAVMAVVSLLISLDTGHQNYLGNLFNRLWLEDPKLLVDTVRSGIRIAVFIAAIELFIGLGIILGGKLDVVSGLKGSSSAWVGGALILNLVFWVLNGSIGGILVRLYVPAGLYAWSQWLGIVYRFSGFLVVIAAVACGASIFGAMLAQVLTWSACNLFTFWDLRRRFPQVHPWWRGGRWTLGWTNFRASLILTINGFVDQAASNGLVVFVGHLFNPLSVAVFTTVRTVANFGLQGSAIMLSPLAPDLVRYHVKGEGNKLASVFSSSWLIGTSMVSAGLTVAVFALEPLYMLWTRGALPLDRVLFATLGTAVAIRQWAAPLQTYLVSMNRLHSQIVMVAVRASFGLGLAALLLPRMGLPAAGLGALAGEMGAAVVAVMTVRPQLISLGASIPGKAAFLSLAQIGTAAVVWLCFAGGVSGLGLWVTLAVSLIAILAWLQWLALTPALKARLLGLIGRASAGA